jgi:hypothetical protein
VKPHVREIVCAAVVSLVLTVAFVITGFTVAAHAAAVPPVSAVTTDAADISETTATLHGVINPGGGDVWWRFEYGVTDAYGRSTRTWLTGSGATSADAPVQDVVSGLQPGTTYHYRLVADGSGRHVLGEDRTFTTAAAAAPEAPAPLASEPAPIPAAAPAPRARNVPLSQATTPPRFLRLLRPGRKVTRGKRRQCGRSFWTETHAYHWNGDTLGEQTWNRADDRTRWADPRGGRVVFDGVTFRNRTRSPVLVAGWCS